MKTVVYTVMTGEYDFISPTVIEPDVQYIAFVDRNHSVTVPDPWEKRILELSYIGNDRRKSRFPKLAPHIFFQADLSIYVDASLLLMNPLKEHAIEMLNGNHDIAAYRHPTTNSLYVEADKVIRLGLDHENVVLEHLIRMKSSGFPDHLGLTENSFIVRRHNQKVEDFNNMWLTEYMNGSQRDQLSFMYCIWKCGLRRYGQALDYLSLNIVMDDARSNQYYVQRKHRRSHVVVDSNLR